MVKKIFRQKVKKKIENYNLAPLDIYNRLSQVDCIKPESIDKQMVHLLFCFRGEAVSQKELLKTVRRPEMLLR